MRIRKEVGYLLLGGIGVVTALGLIGSAWLYVNFQSMLADQKLQGEMLRLQSAAQLYRHRMGMYQGVCRDIGVQANYSCNESENEYVVSVEKEGGKYYCADNTGHFGEQMLPVRSKRNCNYKTN